MRRGVNGGDERWQLKVEIKVYIYEVLDPTWKGMGDWDGSKNESAVCSCADNDR